MTVSDFDAAVAVVLRHEGGWVDDPFDKGGETNFGISMLIIRREGITPELLGLLDLEPGALKGLTVQRAKLLYQKLFWTRFGYGQIADQTVATKVFDASVNLGPGRAHILAQQTAIALGADLTVDGSLGAKSFAAINACFPTAYVQAFGEAMADFYRAIVRRDPAQQRFLNNWLRRASWPNLTLRTVVPDPDPTPRV
jgi:lysozyme family protein